MHLELRTKHDYKVGIRFSGEDVVFERDTRNARFTAGELLEGLPILESLSRSNYENFNEMTTKLSDKIKVTLNRSVHNNTIDIKIIFWELNDHTIAWRFNSKKEALTWYKGLIDALADYIGKRNKALAMLSKRSLIGTIKLDHEVEDA